MTVNRTTKIHFLLSNSKASCNPKINVFIAISNKIINKKIRIFCFVSVTHGTINWSYFNDVPILFTSSLSASFTLSFANVDMSFNRIVAIIMYFICLVKGRCVSFYSCVHLKSLTATMFCRNFFQLNISWYTLQIRETHFKWLTCAHFHIMQIEQF